MALGFSNAPVNFGNVDYSGYERGAHAVAGGLNYGLGSIIQGVQERAAQRQQKEKEKKMRADLAPIVAQMSGGQIDIRDVDPSSLPVLWERAQMLEKQRAANAEQGRMVQALNGLMTGGPITTDRAAGMVAAGVKPEVVKMLAEMSAPEKPAWQPTAVSVQTSRGPVEMVMGSPNNAFQPRYQDVAPLAGDKPRTASVDGTQFYESAPGRWSQVRIPREQETDPLAQFNAKNLREQIAKKEQEYLAEQQAIQKGDETTGIFGFGDKRSDRMERIALEIAHLRQQLQAAERGPGRTQASDSDLPTDTPAVSAPAAAPAPQSYEQRRDEFFRGLREW